jgi:DNA repair exonuclease SbcCD ATPase subunit
MADDNRKHDITFRHLDITNGRVFRKARIPLAGQGLVSILGRNGAGKSTIGNLVEAIMYGSTAGGHKRNDLVQNDGNACFRLEFDKDGVEWSAELQRKGGKWSYSISEGSEKVCRTPHSLKDGPDRMTEIIGLTQQEFEGSVHLTQDAQHILISGKLGQRKEYISNFFGIDTRYDQVMEAAKEELAKVRENIRNVSALSHAEDLLEKELKNLEDCTIRKRVNAENRVNEEVKAIRLLEAELGELRKSLEDRKLYEEHAPLANSVTDPERKMEGAEEEIIMCETALAQAEQIRQRNASARKMNAAMDNLEKEKAELEAGHTGIADADAAALEHELEGLRLLHAQDLKAEPLRRELAALPVLKKIVLDDRELRKAQVEHQTLLNRKNAVESGICDRCGAKYTADDIGRMDAELAELNETIGILLEDLEVVRLRNSKVERRERLEEMLAGMPEFTGEQRQRMAELFRFLPAKKEYDEILSSLAMLERAEIQPEIDTGKMGEAVRQARMLLEEFKKVVRAKQLLPKKTPPDAAEEIGRRIVETEERIRASEKKVFEYNKQLGEIAANYARKNEVKNQLVDLRARLAKLDGLKRDEFFWSKMADAYGPKGLRLQHLNRMMDLIIKRLPAYANILFNEKGLSFSFRCEPNSIEIIARRRRTRPDGETEFFEHDIALFSGGEKSRMSIALILTLADCVPVRKRANILILDEVDSDIDDDGKFRFVNGLLPMLKKKYESIFVISHSSDIQQAMIYDQSWTIVKENHWASITMRKTS